MDKRIKESVLISPFKAYDNKDGMGWKKYTLNFLRKIADVQKNKGADLALAMFNAYHEDSDPRIIKGIKPIKKPIQATGSEDWFMEDSEVGFKVKHKMAPKKKLVEGDDSAKENVIGLELPVRISKDKLNLIVENIINVLSE